MKVTVIVKVRESDKPEESTVVRTVEHDYEVGEDNEQSVMDEVAEAAYVRLRDMWPKSS